MLQQENPEDFVIATGHQISVRDFVERCAQRLGWGGISWSGSGVNEIGVRNDTGEVVIRIDPIYYRPTEVNSLLGDASKAFKLLDWKPKTSIDQLVDEMIVSDLNV